MSDLINTLIAMLLGMFLGWMGVSLCFINDLFTHKCSSCGTTVISLVNGIKVADKTWLCISCYEHDEKRIAEKYAKEVKP